MPNKSEMTTVNVVRDTSQILTVLKMRQNLPTMESVMQWLFINLEKSAKDEIVGITKYLGLPPIFLSNEELQKHYHFKPDSEWFMKTCDEILQSFIAEKFKGGVMGGVGFTSDETDEYVQSKIDALKMSGLAYGRLEAHLEGISSYIVRGLEVEKSEAKPGSG